MPAIFRLGGTGSEESSATHGSALLAQLPVGVHAFDLAALDLVSDQTLDVFDHDLIQPGSDTRNRADRFSAGRSTRAVDVVLKAFRQTEVDHVRQLRNIDTSRGYIGGNQDADLTLAKRA